ncbi:MAG: LysR family transcriptional regulator [Alphaproteobacteria bacterium]|jgi:LysR family glycine cleavage system transcriptional activator|nr:LysR family transcriptional regulator [Alphaproteobacteria bacterium]
MHKLPPLTSLRTFEAAARRGSFTKAAEELHVTQSAVSRQIRTLEEDLGVPLFRRVHRKVRLTADGDRLLPVLTQAFRDIEKTVARLRQPERDVKLKVPPTFAIRWLIPRLERFQTERPDIQVRLTSGLGEVKLGKEPFDLGVIYVRAGEPGRRGDVVVVHRAVPVAAPRYVDHAPPLARPSDLARHQLLVTDASAWDWRRWARAFDVDDLPLDDALQLEPAEAAIQAARSGQGVALVDHGFVARELAAGRLVAPLDVAPLELGHWLAVYGRGVLDDPCVAAFRDWLVREATATPETAAALA